jgi:hypothetical protein
LNGHGGTRDFVFEAARVTIMDFSRKTTYIPSGKPLVWVEMLWDGLLWISITVTQ